MAYKYDPILRMNVPSKDQRTVDKEDEQKAWTVEYQLNGIRVTHSIGVVAESADEAIKKAEKYLSKMGWAHIFGARQKESIENMKRRGRTIIDEKTWDNAIQAADAFVPADEALLKQIEYKLKNLGWTINSKQKYSMYGGSFHYQMTYKEKIDPKNEAQFMKIAEPAADVIDREAKGYEPTFNFGLGKDGSVTCGFDIRGKYERS